VEHETAKPLTSGLAIVFECSGGEQEGESPDAIGSNLAESQRDFQVLRRHSAGLSGCRRFELFEKVSAFLIEADKLLSVSRVVSGLQMG